MSTVTSTFIKWIPSSNDSLQVQQQQQQQEDASLTTSTISPFPMVEQNVDASDTVPPYMQHMTIILVILHMSVFITGLVGNSLVCLSVYRNKSLQTVTNYYIVNLAVADFLVILICLPPTVYWDLTLTWNFGLVLCKLVLYLQSISVSVSVLTLTCISIDRWYAICRPLEFSSTKYRAKITIALIWLASLLFASPDLIYLTTRPLYQENNFVYMDCTYSWPESSTKMYQLCIVTLLFITPFILMSISYSHIVNVLWRNETMADSLQHTVQLEEEQQFLRRKMELGSATDGHNNNNNNNNNNINNNNNQETDHRHSRGRSQLAHTVEFGSISVMKAGTTRTDELVFNIKEKLATGEAEKGKLATDEAAERKKRQKQRHQRYMAKRDSSFDITKEPGIEQKASLVAPCGTNTIKATSDNVNNDVAIVTPETSLTEPISACQIDPSRKSCLFTDNESTCNGIVSTALAFKKKSHAFHPHCYRHCYHFCHHHSNHSSQKHRRRNRKFSTDTNTDSIAAATSRQLGTCCYLCKRRHTIDQFICSSENEKNCDLSLDQDEPCDGVRVVRRTRTNVMLSDGSFISKMTKNNSKLKTVGHQTLSRSCEQNVITPEDRVNKYNNSSDVLVPLRRSFDKVAASAREARFSTRKGDRNGIKRMSETEVEVIKIRTKEEKNLLAKSLRKSLNDRLAGFVHPTSAAIGTVSEDPGDHSLCIKIKDSGNVTEVGKDKLLFEKRITTPTVSQEATIINMKEAQLFEENSLHSSSNEESKSERFRKNSLPTTESTSMSELKCQRSCVTLLSDGDSNCIKRESAVKLNHKEREKISIMTTTIPPSKAETVASLSPCLSNSTFTLLDRLLINNKTASKQTSGAKTQDSTNMASKISNLNKGCCGCFMETLKRKNDKLVADKTLKKYRRNLANYAATRDKYRDHSSANELASERPRSTRQTLTTNWPSKHSKTDSGSANTDMVYRRDNDTVEVSGSAHSITQHKRSINLAEVATTGPTTLVTAATNTNETVTPDGSASLPANHLNSNASCHKRFCKLIESRKKAAKMLIVIVIMFGLCYLPVHFLNILRYTVGLPQNDITTIASLVSHWLCYFNSAVNPLIYNLMSGKFRHEFANLFFCKCFRR